MQALL